MSVPILSIIPKGSRELGRCYNEARYEVISNMPLSEDTIRGLRKLGFLGSGQEFGFGEMTTVKTLRHDLRRWPDISYHVECWSRCDSSD